MPPKKGAKKEEIKLNVQLDITRTDMEEEEKKAVILVVSDAYAEPGKYEKDIAKSIKLALDEKFPKTTWHCIVGDNFATSCTFATKHHLFAVVNRTQHVLIFRTFE